MRERWKSVRKEWNLERRDQGGGGEAVCVPHGGWLHICESVCVGWEWWHHEGVSVSDQSSMIFVVFSDFLRGFLQRGLQLLLQKKVSRLARSVWPSILIPLSLCSYLHRSFPRLTLATNVLQREIDLNKSKGVWKEEVKVEASLLLAPEFHSARIRASLLA